MEWFDGKIFIENIQRPKLWLRYVSDTFIIWLHDKEHLEELLYVEVNEHITIEIENNNSLLFINIMVNHNKS